MGTDTATVSSQSSSAVKIFWQDRPVKYTYEGGHIRVEELKTPWDVYVEGRYFDSPISGTLHQVLIKTGLERVFSIRNADGVPVCDIVTRPQNAPPLSLLWGARRAFHTSSPMTVDGQKLIVMDVVGSKGVRVAEPLIKLAKEFFLAHGGVLRGEHPSGLIYTDRREIKRWKKVVDFEILLDIMIASKPIKKAEQMMLPDTVQAPNAEVAIELLSSRNWYRCFINVDDPWTDQVIDFLENYPEEQPPTIRVYGSGPRFKPNFDRITAMYAKPLPEKSK